LTSHAPPPIVPSDLARDQHASSELSIASLGKKAHHQVAPSDLAQKWRVPSELSIALVYKKSSKEERLSANQIFARQPPVSVYLLLCKQTRQQAAALGWSGLILFNSMPWFSIGLEVLMPRRQLQWPSFQHPRWPCRLPCSQ